MPGNEGIRYCASSYRESKIGVILALLNQGLFVVVQWLSHVQLFATPCPSLFPTVCTNSCKLSQWCYPTISSSATPFSFCLQSFSASGSFPMSQLFASGGQSTGASVSASVLPMNIQGWFPFDWLVWSCSSRNSEEFSPAPLFKSISFSALSLLYGSILISIHD